MTNTNDPYYEPTNPRVDPVVDPAVDPATASVTEPANQPVADRSVAPRTSAGKPKGSLAGGTWVALIFGILLLVLLLVFIIQNPDKVSINLFTWTWELSAGVAYLISAIIGAVIMALVGGLRIMELRRQVRKAAKS